MTSKTTFFVSDPVYTVDVGYDTFLVDASSNNVDITLPDLDNFGDGLNFRFKRFDTEESTTVIVSGEQTIDGSPNFPIPIGEELNIVAYNGLWYVISDTIEGTDGATGPTGPTGPEGPVGPTGSSAINSLYYNSGGNLNDKNYLRFGSQTTIETLGMVTINEPSTLQNLRVKLSNAPIDTAQRIFTVRVNGADTDLVVAITGSLLTGENVSDTVNVAIGNDVSIIHETDGEPIAASARVTLGIVSQ